MKQFQIMYKKKHALKAWLKMIHKFCKDSGIPEECAVFRIFSDLCDDTILSPVLSEITSEFPDSPYAGASSIGNIVYGSLVEEHISITCTIFEDRESRICILQCPMGYDTQGQTADILTRAVEENPWVSAIEIMTTAGGVDMDAFCRRLSALPDRILIYGGCAHATDMKNGDSSNTFVFSSVGGTARHSAVFILLGGPSLHLEALYHIGWTQLGRSIPISGVSGNHIGSMNSEPAGEVYKRFLQIPEGEHYVTLANVFPLGFRTNNTPYLRIVTRTEEDGSVRLSAFVREDTGKCAFTFGNAVEILERLEENLVKMQHFEPQVIQLFSCAARLMFWGRSDTSRETLPFETIAETSGFYTAGEFLRTGKDVLLHNVTIVAVGLREGDPSGRVSEVHVAQEDLSHQMQVSGCLAHFIKCQTEEQDFWNEQRGVEREDKYHG